MEPDCEAPSLTSHVRGYRGLRCGLHCDKFGPVRSVRCLRMPGELVTTLTAPLLELEALLGSGDLAAPGDAVVMLCRAGHALETTAAAGLATATRMSADWTGQAADAAAQSASVTFTATGDAASRAAAIAARVDAAAAAVRCARADLQAILEDFARTAARLEPDLPPSAPAGRVMPSV